MAEKSMMKTLSQIAGFAAEAGASGVYGWGGI
jgi:hypothetical protein